MKKEKRKLFIKQFLFWIIPLFIIVIGITYFIIDNDLNNKITLIKNEENAKIILKKNIIQNEITSIKSDLRALLVTNALFIYWNNPNIENLKALEDEYAGFAESKGIYEQLRVLDISGKERLRINISEGKATIVHKDQLQDKSNRYYFKESLTLSKDEFYISPLDLNIENNEIEMPFKPMIRFGALYYNLNHKKVCVIILNYESSKLLQLIKEPLFEHESEMMLLNPEGYWLISARADEEWGFMFENKKDITFRNKYPEVWKQISEGKAGQIKNEVGLFTYSTVYPAFSQRNYEITNFTKNNNQYWKVVSLVPSTVIDKITSELLNRWLLIDLFVLIGAAIAIGFISNLRMKNILAAKQIKKQLKKATELNQKIIDSQIILTERNNKKDKFLSLLSHDLKNPLGTLKNYAIMLYEDYDEMEDKERKSFIDGIRDISESTLDLLYTLLDWGKMNVDGEAGEHTYINLNKIVNENIALIKHNAESKSIELKLTIDEKIEVLVDENMVNSLFRNFLSNAIKFTEKNGLVQVIADMKQDEVCICIADNGVGMTKEQLHKFLELNERFTTKGTNQEKGTGVGLMLSKEFIEKHNGKLRIESEVGKGSKFCFNLRARIF